MSNEEHFGTFLFLCFYNFTRFFLLKKTKELELQQDASGLPVRFTLQMTYWYYWYREWGFWYRISNLCFWINIVVVLIHIKPFFDKTIPAP